MLCFKNTLDMDDDNKEKVIDYITEIINSSSDKEHGITIMGGEIGLLSPKNIIEFVNKLNSKLKYPERVGLELDTNLVYKLTQEHIELFRLFKEIKTSYDIGRFLTDEQYNLWKHNVYKVKLLSDIMVTICVTRDLIEIPPEQFFNTMVQIGTDNYNLATIAPSEYNIKRWGIVKGNNRKEDDWLFDMYILYKEYKIKKPNFRIFYFDNIENLMFNGIEFEDFCRCCMDSRRILYPDNKVSFCPFTQHKPFYNLNTNTLDQENYDYWHNIEKNVKEECKKCHLFKYCKGIVVFIYGMKVVVLLQKRYLNI